MNTPKDPPDGSKAMEQEICMADTVAALFVDESGPYSSVSGVEMWGISRDARNYSGPHPVVAHPPCERWGRYWSGGPSAKVRRYKGDDHGCFDRALWAVRTFGGVLEHPAHSHAWDYYNLESPPQDLWGSLSVTEFVTQVDQGHYGHKAQKRTWLYVVKKNQDMKLRRLIWGPAKNKQRLDEGFHSKEERAAARAAGKKPIPRLSKEENIFTPPRFRDVLIEIARSCR